MGSVFFEGQTPSWNKSPWAEIDSPWVEMSARRACSDSYLILLPISDLPMYPICSLYDWRPEHFQFVNRVIWTPHGHWIFRIYEGHRPSAVLKVNFLMEPRRRSELFTSAENLLASRRHSWGRRRWKDLWSIVAPVPKWAGAGDLPNVLQ